MKPISIVLSATILLATYAASARTLLVHHINDPTIKTMTLERVGTEYLSTRSQEKFMTIPGDCSGAPVIRFKSDIPSTGDLRLDLILNLGAKLFEIVKANGPLINATTKTANALPTGISCWNQLEQWSMPRSEVYRVSYKNLYGITMVDFQFRVVYNYGGRVGEVGRYLANATIQYKKIDAKWGTVIDANVEIPQVLNIGTRENPIAGMQLDLNWSVSTRPIALRKMTNSASFFIAGDGRRTTLLK